MRSIAWRPRRACSCARRPTLALRPDAHRTHRVAPAECDTGIVQIDSLRLDVGETLRRAAAFYATLGDRAAAEARFLREQSVTLVVGDIPPLAFAAAAAGAPALPRPRQFHVGLDLRARTPRRPATYPSLVPAIGAAYAPARSSRCGCRSAAASSRSRAIDDVPFVARRGRHAAERHASAVRPATGWPSRARLVWRIRPERRST